MHCNAPLATIARASSGVGVPNVTPSGAQSERRPSTTFARESAGEREAAGDEFPATRGGAAAG